MANPAILIIGDYKSERIKFIEGITATSTQACLIPDAKTRYDQLLVLQFGQLTVDDNLSLHLFATPDSLSFEFSMLRERFQHKILGVILLMSTADEDTFKGTEKLLQMLISESPVPYIIAINFMSQRTPTEIRALLKISEQVKVSRCPTLDKLNIKNVLLDLFALIPSTQVVEHIKMYLKTL